MKRLTLRQRIFLLLQHCLPQHKLSQMAGVLAASEIPWLKNILITLFAGYFKVDMRDAMQTNTKDYTSFNQFFTRALKPETRPIDRSGLSSPVDGTISQLGKIYRHEILQAKSRGFSLSSLLANDSSLTEEFYDGQFATIYLSPKDYHRIHMPCSGRLIKTIYVPGELFSVNETTAQSVDDLFARNERLICEFETEQGPMVMILVGAMIVAGIQTVWHDYSELSHQKIIRTDTPTATLAQGDEMGRFKLGSTVILLFPKDTINWRSGLTAGRSIQMGETIAKQATVS